MKYADDHVRLDNEEMALQGTTDKLTEIGTCYGMEINANKTKGMRIRSEPSPVQIMMARKQLENVEYFSYLCSTITNDPRYIRENKSRIAKAKQHSTERRLSSSANLT